MSEIDNIYQSGAYADKNPTWHEEDAPWKALQIEKLIRTSGIKHDKIVEIGCGTGDILLNLEASFPQSRFTGYEISPQAFARAKSKETEKTSFYLKDAMEDKHIDYDVALIIDVVEHVDDYLGFVKNIRPIARYKIFHIPLDLSVQSVFRQHPILRLRENVGHLHYFFKETALAMIRDCGYDVIKYTYTASRLELPNQALSSLIMKIPRRVLFAINPDMAVRFLGGYSLLVLAE